MKLVASLVLLACVIASPRLAAADEPEDTVQTVVYGGMGSLVIAASVASVKFASDDFKDGPQTRTHHAVELGVSRDGLAVGTSLLVLGEDQHDRTARSFGIVMMAATLPTTLHGAWGMATGNDVDADDRRNAGLVELRFAIPLAGIEGMAISGFAADPVDHVRAAGVTTSTVLLVPSALMIAHGVYLLATSSGEPTSVFAKRDSSRVHVMPVLVGSGDVGLGAAGTF